MLAKTADSTIMKRRLAVRDRLVRLVAFSSLSASSLYVVFPLWVVVAAVVALLGVPVLVRRWRH